MSMNVSSIITVKSSAVVAEDGETWAAANSAAIRRSDRASACAWSAASRRRLTAGRGWCRYRRAADSLATDISAAGVSSTTNGCCRLHTASLGQLHRPLCSVPQTSSWFITGHRWLGSRVVSVLTSGAEGPRFKSQSRRCRVTVLGKLFTPIVPLFTKQRNW